MSNHSALRRCRDQILAAWAALCGLEALHAGCTLRCDYRAFVRLQLRVQGQRYADLQGANHG